MDFIRTEVIEHKVPAKVELENADGYVNIKINGYYVLAIQSDGTFKRYLCCRSCTGLQTDNDTGKIKESK